MGSKRKRVILYQRHVLTNGSDLVERLKLEAKKKRLVVEEIVAEADLKQPRLRKLLQSPRTRVILVPSLFHFAAPDQLVRLVLQAHRNGVELFFQREGLRLRKMDARTRTIIEVFESMEDARLYARSVSIRQSLMIAKLLAGKQIGRAPAKQTARARVIELLREEKSYRSVAKEVGMSKGYVQKVAREEGLRPAHRERRKASSIKE